MASGDDQLDPLMISPIPHCDFATVKPMRFCQRTNLRAVVVGHEKPSAPSSKQIEKCVVVNLMLLVEELALYDVRRVYKGTIARAVVLLKISSAHPSINVIREANARI
jgi:hypothetical protein